jgi:RNA methyltransferase, TrmH family
MKTISSRDNPLYRALLALASDRRARRQSGRTLLDGPHLLQAGLDSGVRFQQLVFSETGAAGELKEWHQRLHLVPACVLPQSLFKTLTPVDSPVGVMAVIDIPQPSDANHGDCIVLLESIQEPGNLGAILRVAAASGADAVYLSQGCSDAWSAKCLRGGQGAHFQLAIHENVDLPALVQGFGAPVYAASLQGRIGLFDLDLRGRVGFAFGNEGAGLTAQLSAAARPFIIPMSGRVESLNVATAAAVCLFERFRQGRA